MSSMDCYDWRKDFPSLERKYKGHQLAFFDGPGGTQVPRQVIDAIVDYYTRCNANTHGQFITSKKSDELLEESRTAVAAFLNASSKKEISFGANMTTLNIFLSRALAKGMRKGQEVLITQLDHEANRGPWLLLEERGLKIREIALKSNGALDYEDFAAKINSQTRVVAVGWASNAIGTVNDLARIRELSASVGALLVVDAVHYAPHFPIDVRSCGIDFLLCSAYKFYGPHVGVLYSRKGLLDRLETDRLRTQDKCAPYRIETGTLNHAALAGVKAAVEYIASLGTGVTLRDRIVSAMKRINSHEHDLAHLLFSRLRSTAGVTLYGPAVGSEQRAPTISLRIEGFSPEEGARRLGEKGLLVWDGDFYAVRPAEIFEVADSGGWIRVGMSLYNTRQEVERLLREMTTLADEGLSAHRNG